ncbi:MAG: hypothetical protein N2595_04640, partial [bacterium]|nr:hypothetical protein [bacterium]
MRRAISIVVWLGGVGCWVVMAILLAPPHFVYRFFFLGAAMASGVLTYWWPRLGWMYTVGLLPLANMPSRALAFGAHEALIFVTLACGLGWWANRMVTRKPAWLPEGLRVPTILLLLVTLSSGVVTGLRYADFCLLTGEPFRNVWANVTGELDAATAVRVGVLATLRDIQLPVLLWVSYGILVEDEQMRAQRWRWVMRVWGVGFVVVLGIVLYQSYFEPGFCLLHEPAWRESGRVSGGLSDPNALGLVMCLLMPLWGLAAWERGGLSQMGYLMLTGGAGYALLQSGSRSGMLGVVLVGAMGGVAFAWRRAQRGISWRDVGVSVASVMVLAACVIAPLFFSTGGEESSAVPLLRRLHGFYERLQSGST